ncbi:hypothetical protein [Aquimarina megaterium]|uniref:hypothetical protein n=1 Tax=Aquimarina megaterium TaxID=1443666 RepID=UPI000945496A|nr:hypothetical protein [Aquimarina megaterium]
MLSNKRNKTCCIKLKGLYDVSPELGVNFRVIKNSNEFIEESKNRGFPIENGKLKYILTDGYSGRLSSKESKLLFIEYCPFCGKKLSKIFKDDSQINEENHEW